MRGFALRADMKQLYYFRSAADFTAYVQDHSENKIAGAISLLNAQIYDANFVEHDFCIELRTAPPELR